MQIRIPQIRNFLYRFRGRRLRRLNAWAADRSLAFAGAPIKSDNFTVPAGVAARNQLVLSAVPLNGSEVTIGAVTYRFVNALAQANDVLIEATVVDSILNLFAAINAGAGGGVKYHAATVEHALVQATSAWAAAMLIRAKVLGVGGNGIACATTVVGAAWEQPATYNGLAGGLAIAVAGGHGRQTGAGPVVVNSTQALPAGLTAMRLYWVGSYDSDHLTLHRTQAEAFRGINPVVLGDAGLGVHTIWSATTPAAILELLRQGISAQRITMAATINELI